MADLTKIHTPLERRRYRAGSFASQAMQSGPLAIGPISGLKLRTENAVPGNLRRLGIQSKLCLISYSCEVVEPRSSIRLPQGQVESSQNCSSAYRSKRQAAQGHRDVDCADQYEWRVIYKRCCLHHDVIGCPDDRERFSGLSLSFSLAGPRVACDGACAIRMFGRKYTTLTGCVCRGRRDFPVKRAEDSGGDDNPVQGCTKRVTLKAERCRRRHFFHIPDRIRATSGQRSPARTTADVTNGPRSRIEGRFADDSTFIPSLRDSHV
jgi:hypothetical protein